MLEVCGSVSAAVLGSHSCAVVRLVQCGCSVWASVIMHPWCVPP